MRVFISSHQVLQAADEIRAASKEPGGYVFLIESSALIDDPPKPAPPLWRCKYHGVENCFTCQYQQEPVKP